MFELNSQIKRLWSLKASYVPLCFDMKRMRQSTKEVEGGGMTGT
jgi:hypothetical protein